MSNQTSAAQFASGTEGAKPDASTWWIMAGLSLAMLLSSLGTSLANIALPTLAQAFHVPFQDVQWVVLAYLLSVTTLVVGVGRLGDMVGRRRLLLAGFGLFTVASAACGLAPTLPLLIAARGVQGLGAAVMMVLPVALVGETVPKARTGSAMGLLGATSAIGTALGPSVGGMLMSGFGWRAPFLAILPLGALGFALAYRALPRSRATGRAGRPRFDVAGTVLLALALTAYALAMTLGRGRFGAINGILLAVAALGAGLFLRAQARAASPLIRPDMAHDPVLRAGLAMSALVMTVMMATLVVGPFYLSRGLGHDMAAVGYVMSAGPLLAALAGVPAGRLVDRFGAGRMIAIGLVAMVSGACALAASRIAFGIAGYVTPLVVVTSGYVLFQAANTTAVMANVAKDRRGVVSGMLTLSRNLGLVTGASVMGAVFAFGSGAVDVATARPDAVAAGTRVTFAVAAALSAVALGIALASRSGPARRG